MKKNKIRHLISIVSLIIITCILIPHSHAQRNFGIKGGLNLATMTIEEADDSNIIPGFHAGFFGEFILTEKFSLQPEVLFSTKGVEATYDSDFLNFDVANGETTLNISYIDIPVYVKFNLAEDFNFHLGPYLGILLNAKYESENEILDFINIDDADDIDRDQFNTFDYGITGGLGFELEPFLFGFNYNLGLRPAARENEAMRDLLEDAKNNLIQIYFGFSF